MACFVGESYKYDVFISYATAGELLKPISENIYHEIKDRLTLLLGPTGSGAAVREELKVYFNRDRDQQNTANPADILNVVLREEVEASAIFLMFWSSWYANSEVCKFERKTWLEKHIKTDRKASNISVQRRFIPVLLQSKSLEGFKGDLELIKHYFGNSYNPIGVKFYQPDGLLPLGYKLPDPYEDAAFRSGIEAICSTLRDLLEKMRNENLTHRKGGSEFPGTVDSKPQPPSKRTPPYTAHPTQASIVTGTMTPDKASSSHEILRGKRLDPEQKTSEDIGGLDEEYDVDELRGISLK